MLHVTKDEKGNQKVVSVAVDDENYKFPKDHPTRRSSNGKMMFVSPVEYDELELADVTLSDENWTTLLVAQNTTEKQDVIDAMNAGLRLAQGDAVKSAYKVKQGQKILLEALQWIITKPDLLTTYAAMTDKEAAKTWLLGQYRDR